MKVGITGAANFVNRMFEACGNYQWAREFLLNALEAHATKIEFGIEWQAVAKDGVYRRTIADDGDGMDGRELIQFFSTLGAGAKPIGGVHDNFGVGAKIASLPWNPAGVVVISYKNGKGAMIWIALDEDSGDYELLEFEGKEGGAGSCVTEPGEIDGLRWDAMRPEWLKEHGTIIVLLGSKDHPDTVLGNPAAGETDIKGLSVYLNTRFWDLSGVEVRVVELRSDKKAKWPLTATERDDVRRPNNRQIQGARYYLTDVAAEKGKLAAQDKLALADGRVVAEWYLWSGDRPMIHMYAKRPGYIAVRYKGELYELTSMKPHFRWFGVVESAVQSNLTIILEPHHYQQSVGRWGVHPDQSRNRLIFTGSGEKGVAIPLADWGLEFAEKLPEEIRSAIRDARAGTTGSIDDEDYRKRLQDKFGARWTSSLLVKAPPKTKPNRVRPATGTGDDVEVYDEGADAGGDGGSDGGGDAGGDAGGGPAAGSGGGGPGKGRKRKLVLLPGATVGGADDGALRAAPVDVPKFRFARKDEFERPWHLALYSELDAVEGAPTVVINLDSPILEQAIRYHQEQYADVHAEEIAKTVQRVFGEVAACKIAHSQKLARHVPKEELDRDYRSERALTVALMGLMAEEAVIAQRLGKFGRKRAADPVEARVDMP